MCPPNLPKWDNIKICDYFTSLTVIPCHLQNGANACALADVAIKLPETETYLIQELTLPIYHYLCSELENYFFG